MASTVIRNLVDAYTDSTKATKNFGTLNRMYFGGNGAQLAYTFWANVVPSKAKIVKATYYGFAADAWPANQTVKIGLADKKWEANTLKHNPPASRPASTQTKTITIPAAKAVNEMVPMDITDLYQSVSSGTAFYGLVIDSANPKRALHSTQAANAALRPYVEVEWAENPLPPEGLSPSNNQAVTTSKPTVTWNFLDFVGDTTQAAFQVQFSTASSFASIDHDSGVVNDSAQRYNLAATSYSIAVGQSRWWRVKTMDKTGYWSDWSLPAQMRVLAMFTVSITNPFLNNGERIVEEATPPISWQLSSGTQRSVRVAVYDFTLGRFMMDQVYSTADTQMSLPAGVLTIPDGEYQLTVRAEDTIDRIATPGAPNYAEASVRFFYRLNTGSVSPVTSLTSVSADGAEILNFTRATPPDSFSLYSDGRIIATDLDPLDYQDKVDGTKYKIPTFPKGRQSIVQGIVCVVNGKSSASTLVTKIIKRRLSYVSKMDGSKSIPFLEASVDAAEREVAQVVEPMAGGAFLVVQDGVSGLMGTFTGVFVESREVTTLLAKDATAYLDEIWKKGGGACRIVSGRYSIQAYMYGVKVRDVPNPDGTTDMEISFNFLEIK